MIEWTNTWNFTTQFLLIHKIRLVTIVASKRKVLNKKIKLCYNFMEL